MLKFKGSTFGVGLFDTRLLSEDTGAHILKVEIFDALGSDGLYNADGLYFVCDGKIGEFIAFINGLDKMIAKAQKEHPEWKLEVEWVSHDWYENIVGDISQYKCLRNLIDFEQVKKMISKKQIIFMKAEY